MTRAYRDDVTIWVVGDEDGYGDYSYGSPRLLKGRWEDVQEEFISRDGEKSFSNANVYLNQNTVIKLGDYVYKGVSENVDPSLLDDAFPIKKLSAIPDLRRVRTELRAIL